MEPQLPSAETYAAERARFGALEAVDLQALQKQVVDDYRNQVMLDANDHCLRLSVFEGEYRWHVHPDTDELFLVAAGELHIEFGEGVEVVLRDWQCLTVPAGKVHRTRAVGRTVNVTFEKQGAKTVFVEPPSAGRPGPAPRSGVIPAPDIGRTGRTPTSDTKGKMA